MKPADKARRTMLMVEIPRDELAIRIAIQCAGTRPKAGMTPDQAFAAMDQVAPGMSSGFRLAADAAFFHECINASRQPS